MGEIRVGTSGWSYDGWHGDFYPDDLPRREELAYLSRRLTSVEVNGSFYSLQRPSSYRAWRDATPEDFVLAVKGGRFITHVKRLRGIEAPLANFFASGVLALGPKLGPVLWQLPENLPYDTALMADFYALLPRTTAAAADLASRHDERLSGDRVLASYDVDRPVAHVLEFRNRSFCTDEALAQMREHDIGCVVADSDGRWPRAEAVTSGVVHVRLHGHTKLYTSRYSSRSLDKWAVRCRRWAEQADVFVYFDNDADGHAPHDAEALLRRLD
ncbi:uncharacterized protein YecE (DUF72 family) [Nocardioides aromaticivorans]|uniref:Uncharacterized protein YecE (DUF72 family) n=1 Tax=Nocardioides aromaticivorans TaxID=200618 RepID=A0A7Y9ZDV5_9ACTN|nr:DUF72 domain-containing protein [Nocardioides aromaticivorans]NYI43161.1 uncharacterized protein YecE (DUF72 family) [Nocardioides aromaticivorans]